VNYDPPEIRIDPAAEPRLLHDLVIRFIAFLSKIPIVMGKSIYTLCSTADGCSHPFPKRQTNPWWKLLDLFIGTIFGGIQDDFRGTCLHLSWICIVYTETCVYIYIDNICNTHSYIYNYLHIYILVYCWIQV
jgi:hypothetical protein